MKEAPWPRRAVVEFVTIIAAVLVALAVNGAWQARADRINEREYIGAVIDELRGNMTNVESNLRGAARAHAALERARRIQDAGQLRDSAPQFITGVVTGVTFIPAPNVSRAVVQDLVSTGNIKLVRNLELRRTILETYTSMDATLDRIERAQRSVASGLEALVSRQLPPNTVSRASGAKQGSALTIEVSGLPQDQQAIRLAASQIAANATFRQELNAEYRRLERARQQLESLQSSLQSNLVKLLMTSKANGPS